MDSILQRFTNREDWYHLMEINELEELRNQEKILQNVLKVKAYLLNMRHTS